MSASSGVGQRGSGKTRVGPGWSATGWLLGIVGGISLFLGLFVLIGNETTSIGIGGDLSWQVGEVADIWTYGLLIGGGLALLLALSIAVFAPRREVTATWDVSELTWHIVAFVVVNAFIWFQDIAIGGGVDYAYWITIPWGIGVTIHAVMAYRNHRPPVPGRLGEPQPH